MSESEFERLLRENEPDLSKIRSRFFPLMRDRVITGYNIYQTDKIEAQQSLCYYHSDLKADDQHFQELIEKLKSNEFTNLIALNGTLSDRLTRRERNADYILKASWKNPLNIRYFDFKANEIKDLSRFKGKHIVGEGVQYDLLIEIEDLNDLRKLIDLFKKYTSLDKLNKKGKKILDRNGIPIKNTHAITEAWDVPLLIFSGSKKPSNLTDFLTVDEFNISTQLGKNPLILNTFVRDASDELAVRLDESEIHYSKNKKYVLRVFVEEN